MVTLRWRLGGRRTIGKNLEEDSRGREMAGRVELLKPCKSNSQGQWKQNDDTALCAYWHKVQ